MPLAFQLSAASSVGSGGLQQAEQGLERVFCNCVEVIVFLLLSVDEGGEEADEFVAVG